MLIIKTLPPNTEGRDFVIGDLHGYIDYLRALLDHVEFDTNKDRLFSVGDLIDRGPDSLQCLKLLDEPWFFAVKGNHEDMAYMAVEAVFGGPKNPETDGMWLLNGGMWYIMHGEHSVIDPYIQKTAVLPHIITVNGDNKFHVLHAQLDRDGGVITDQLLANVSEAETIALKTFTYDGAMVLWGRMIFRLLHGKNLISDGHEKHIEKFIAACKYHKLTDWMKTDALSNIYVGHTPVFNPTKVDKLINLDTGVQYAGGKDKDLRYGLTITQVGTNNFWKINDIGIQSVKLVEIST